LTVLPAFHANAENGGYYGLSPPIPFVYDFTPTTPVQKKTAASSVWLTAEG
jgi:hypothetical protein